MEFQRRQSNTLSLYCIAFLDILGQKDDILSLRDIPLTQEDKDKAIRILRSTVGTVINLRKAFHNFSEERNRDRGRFDYLPPEQQAEVQKIRQNKAEIRGVSDSTIITIPLSSDGEFAASILSIYSSLWSICAMFVLSLLTGKPFRGGVDIGWGLRLPDAPEEVYGSALVKAHNLESRCAEYPRVLVGDALLEYINDIEAISPDNINRQFAKMYAAKCKAIITVDYDALNILDVIGEEAKSITGGMTSEMVQKGYKYVVATHKRLTIAGDTKLGPRYGRLRNYLESRLHLWNIQPCV